MGADGCPESVSGHGTNTKSGKCQWCGKKVYAALPAPRRMSEPTEADTEYRRKYDPDFGTRKGDV